MTVCHNERRFKNNQIGYNLKLEFLFNLTEFYKDGN